jgi:elongator complex protein 2
VLTGHEDWVKSLAFCAPVSPADPLVLASGSQDGTIRLWNVEPFATDGSRSLSRANGDTLSDDLLDAFEASFGDFADDEAGGRQISLKQHIVTVKVDEKK